MPYRTQEERTQFAGELLIDMAKNHTDEFKHYFKAKESMIKLVLWFDKRATDGFSDEDIEILTIVKVCSFKIVGLALLKQTVAGWNDDDGKDFNSIFGFPENYNNIVLDDDNNL